MRPSALLPTSYIQHLHSLSFFDYRLISVDVTINDSWKAASNIGLTESKKKKNEYVRFHKEHGVK